METTEPHSKPSPGLTPAATEMRAGNSQSYFPRRPQAVWIQAQGKWFVFSPLLEFATTEKTFLQEAKNTEEFSNTSAVFCFLRFFFF